MIRVAHFSDVHVQVDYRREPWRPLGWRRWAALVEMFALRRQARYVHAEATLQRLSSEAIRHRADHVVLSGDLTAMALDEEFSRARAALSAVATDPTRFSVIPGNHDVYAPDAVRAQRFARHFGAFLHSDLPAFRREGPYPFVHLVGSEVAVVGLCSARVPLFPGAAVGWIGKPQLQGLAALLQAPELQGRFVFVTVHHAPLARSGRPDTPTHGLVDARALMALLPGDGYAVLFGHIHQRYHHPATATRPHLFGAGSSTSLGHEGYWLYEIEGGALKAAHRLALGEDPPARA